MTTSTISDAIEDIPPEQGKFCANCAHLIGNRHYPNKQELVNWKCGHPNNTVEWKVDLVTGLKYRIFKEENIYKVRDPGIDRIVDPKAIFRAEMCGPKGNWYEQYVEPERISPSGYDIVKPAVKIGGKEAKEIIENPFSEDQAAAIRRKAQENIAARKALKNVKASDL